MDVIKSWVNELPDIEGHYLMEDSSGRQKRVQIENMAVDNDPTRPSNFHVIEDQECYSLSFENGYEEYSWHLIKKR